MYKKVTIEQLEVGMYVEAIADQNGVKKISQKGVISSDGTLEKLKEAGVQSVIIDVAKALQMESTNSQSSDPLLEKHDEPEKQVTTSGNEFSAQVSKAYSIYNQAKDLLEKSVSNWSRGEILDINAFISISDTLIDSLFEDQDAMLLATMIRHKDEYLLEHSINVALLMAAFAHYLELPHKLIRELTLGAFLHDIGKVKVDNAILHKPGKLTDDEFEIMKAHVTYGIEAVEGHSSITDVTHAVISEHHEKLDGTGYPNNLKGDEISLYGRMATIVDVYDAITSDRCYKAGMLSSKTFKLMLQASESHFDSELVGKFIKCMGVYPVGSLVELSRGKLGVVIRANKTNPLRPKVKVFYSLTQKHYIEPVEIDLARTYEKDEIQRSLHSEDVGVDIPRFFEEFIL